MNSRRSGILLHISSLPSNYGIGDFGPGAYAFVDWLSECRQRIWQILPLTPIEEPLGNSPYNSTSAFAGNTLFISPEYLIRDGILDASEVNHLQLASGSRVNFREVTQFKEKIHKLVFQGYEKGLWSPGHELEEFRNQHAFWLKGYCHFYALHRKYALPWTQWPLEFRNGKELAASATLLDKQCQREAEKEELLQFLFWKQWKQLIQYCEHKDVLLMGDLPIYINHDSADVWANPEIFNLDENFATKGMAGVPPDYFSTTGQLWGNPTYRWDVIQKNDFSWWTERIEHNLSTCHVLRLDHFRGFVAFWEVAAGETTAINGRWVDVPIHAFFKKLLSNKAKLPFVAEDLGIITDDVREAMIRYELPGMKVLLFAFGGDLDTNPYVPHNIDPRSVVYTGTHDNTTARGWLADLDARSEIVNASQYLGKSLTLEEGHWELIRVAMASVAEMCIYPLQDVLGLDGSYRMNTPGTVGANWEYRMELKHLTPEIQERLVKWVWMYGRARQ